jgi:vacuolar-type H+-ATPase subunit I/STV1
MSEASNNPVGSEENVGQDAQSTQADSNVDYKALYFEEVENAKKQRHSKQELSKQLAEIEKEKETAKVKELKEEIRKPVAGISEELADELQKKVDTLSPFKDKYEAFEAETRDSLLNQLPEEDRGELANKDIGTIRLFVNKFNNQKPSNVEHVPGRVKEVPINKPYSEMNDAEKRAYYTQQAQAKANRR